MILILSFASVEQQYRPALQGKPIGCYGNKWQGCIIAASPEIKKFGVKSPSRVFEAQLICPTLQTVPADFTKYFNLQKIFKHL